MAARQTGLCTVLLQWFEPRVLLVLASVLIGESNRAAARLTLSFLYPLASAS